MSSKSRGPAPTTGGYTKVRIADTTSSGALRFGQWTDGVENDHAAAWDGTIDEGADFWASDDVLTALKDQRGKGDAGEIHAVVGT